MKPIRNDCKTKTTARGFEPLRAEPNGFQVHHLNHSVTLSVGIAFNICSFKQFVIVIIIRFVFFCSFPHHQWDLNPPLSDCKLAASAALFYYGRFTYHSIHCSFSACFSIPSLVHLLLFLSIRTP